MVVDLRPKITVEWNGEKYVSRCATCYRCLKFEGMHCGSYTMPIRDGDIIDATGDAPKVRKRNVTLYRCNKCARTAKLINADPLKTYQCSYCYPYQKTMAVETITMDDPTSRPFKGDGAMPFDPSASPPPRHHCTNAPDDPIYKSLGEVVPGDEIPWSLGGSVEALKYTVGLIESTCGATSLTGDEKIGIIQALCRDTRRYINGQ